MDNNFIGYHTNNAPHHSYFSKNRNLILFILPEAGKYFMYLQT